jgi:ClpP class serine protease
MSDLAAVRRLLTSRCRRRSSSRSPRRSPARSASSAARFVTGGVYEKLGAHIESTSIGKHAEINSPARPYNPDELKKLQEQLQSFYDQFVEKVAESRHSTPEKIDAIAQGRVWTGRQAKQNGLVDELGGSSARSRLRSSARRSRPTATSKSSSIRREELLRAAVGSVERIGRSGRSAPG